MKAILCVLLMCTGINRIVVAQAPLPTAGPSFSSKDTTKAAVIAVASMQAYPTGFDRLSTRQDTAVTIDSAPVERVASAGPIQDWHNPPGYTGTSVAPGAMTRHKPLRSKKYHQTKPNRCYTF